MIDFRQLIKAGVHFGHQTSRWCPKMAPYIWGFKNDVHLIDVSKTASQMEKAAKFLESVVAEGKTVLWVGTKKPAQAIVQEAALASEMPFVNHRWIGGTLSNYSQVKKSLTKMLHYEDVLSKSDSNPHYTKKEFNVFGKIVGRLDKNVGGIRGMRWPIGALVLVDVSKERSALKEAVAMGIPVVALVDTNGDPSLVDYVIPGNDDAPRAIKEVIDYLSQAAQKGKAAARSAGKEKQVIAAEEFAPQMDEQVALVLARAEEEEQAAKYKQEETKKVSAKKIVMLEDGEEAVAKVKAEKAPRPAAKSRSTAKNKAE